MSKIACLRRCADAQTTLVDHNYTPFPKSLALRHVIALARTRGADMAVDMAVPEITEGLSGDNPRNSARPVAAPISAPSAPIGRKSLGTPPGSTGAFRG